MVDTRALPDYGNGSQAYAEDPLDLRELGSSGGSIFQDYLPGEYNPQLVGLNAISVYDRMKRSDPQVRASLRIVKSPLVSAEWFVEPASDSELDQRIARQVWWNLNDMSRTLVQVLTEALMMLDYGYYMFEKVYEYGYFEGRRVVRWKKWSPRHPRSLQEWKFDRNGGVDGIKHARGEHGTDVVSIPIRKLLIFTFDEEAGNPEGVSILRSAYESWYFKKNFYKIDGVQKERHGIGIPHVTLPANATPEDKRLANKMAKNLRTNEMARVVTPPGFIVDFLELRGQLVSPLESAAHHGIMILMNVLAQFLGLGTSDTGSRAISEAHQDIFEKNLKVLADLICAIVNQYAIPQLVNYNYVSVRSYPKLKARQLSGEAIIRGYSVAVQNAVNAGILTPTPELETWFRGMFGMPLGGAEVTGRGVEDRKPKGQRPTSERENEEEPTE